MKGSNELHLNEATMLIAIQHYFDTVLFAAEKAPNALTVKQQNSKGYGPEVFVVGVTDKSED